MLPISYRRNTKISVSGKFKITDAAMVKVLATLAGTRGALKVSGGVSYSAQPPLFAVERFVAANAAGEKPTIIIDAVAGELRIVGVQSLPDFRVVNFLAAPGLTAGEYSFTYQAFDGELWSDLTTVTLNLHETNAAPVAEADELTNRQRGPTRNSGIDASSEPALCC